MNSNGVLSNGHGKNFDGEFTAENGFVDIRDEIFGISDYSSRLEKILLSLLKQQESLKGKLEEVVNHSQMKEKELEKYKD